MYSLPKCGVEQDEMLQAASTIGSAMTDFVSEAIMPHNKQSLGYWCHRALCWWNPHNRNPLAPALHAAIPNRAKTLNIAQNLPHFILNILFETSGFFVFYFLVVIFVYICVIFYNGWAFVYPSFKPFYEFCAIYCFIGEITLWYYNYSNCLPTLF